LRDTVAIEAAPVGHLAQQILQFSDYLPGWLAVHALYGDRERTMIRMPAGNVKEIRSLAFKKHLNYILT
jgi:hypothetical protein